MIESEIKGLMRDRFNMKVILPKNVACTNPPKNHDKSANSESEFVWKSQFFDDTKEIDDIMELNSKDDTFELPRVVFKPQFKHHHIRLKTCKVKFTEITDKNLRVE